MPEINTDKVCFVIIKAREFDVQVGGLEADDSNATDDNFASVFASGRDDSVRKELKAFIDGMDEDEQCASSSRYAGSGVAISRPTSGTRRWRRSEAGAKGRQPSI